MDSERIYIHSFAHIDQDTGIWGQRHSTEIRWLVKEGTYVTLTTKENQKKSVSSKDMGNSKYLHLLLNTTTGFVDYPFNLNKVFWLLLREHTLLSKRTFTILNIRCSFIIQIYRTWQIHDLLLCTVSILKYCSTETKQDQADTVEVELGLERIEVKCGVTLRWSCKINAWLCILRWNGLTRNCRVVHRSSQMHRRS